MLHIPKAGIATLFLGAQDAAPQQGAVPQQDDEQPDQPEALAKQLDEPVQQAEQTDESALLDGLHVATYNLVPQGYERSGGQEPEKAEQNIILQREK